MPKKLYLLLLALILVTAGCNSESNPDRAIGEVNGQAILGADYDKLINLQTVVYQTQTGAKLQADKDQAVIKDIQDKAFEQLVMDLVLQQEAEKRGISVSEKQVEEALANVKASVTEAGYQRMIQDTGLTESDIKSMVKIEIISQAVQDNIARNAQVSDAQIKDYYQQNQDDYKVEAGMEIYHILVADEAGALDILNRLKKGEDFAGLAAEYSIDTGSRMEGGYVGIGNANSAWVEEFKNAALKLKAGELTEAPVKSQYGYHIIKAGKQVKAGIKPLEEVKEEIRNILKNQQATRAINELRQKAIVKDLRSQ